MRKSNMNVITNKKMHPTPINMKDKFSRFGNKWTVNELISLQREFELLELSIAEIAALHNRTEAAILFKLQSEGMCN